MPGTITHLKSHSSKFSSNTWKNQSHHMHNPNHMHNANFCFCHVTPGTNKLIKLHNISHDENCMSFQATSINNHISCPCFSAKRD